MGQAFSVTHPDFIFWQNAQIIISVISMTGSLSVILTLLYHWKAMVKSKMYPKIILMISVSDFLASLSNSWGYPTNEDVCSAQGWMSVYFTRCVWTWSTMLACTLAYNLLTGKESLSFATKSMLVWGINFFVQCLPYLSADFYGLPDDFLGSGLCSFGRRYEGVSKVVNVDNVHWYFYTYAVPLFLTIFITFTALGIVFFRVLPQVSVMNVPEAANKVRSLIFNASFYPLMTFFLWTPTLVVFMIVYYYYPEPYPSDLVLELPNLIFTVLFGSYGIWLSLFYFSNSQEALRRNRRVFNYYYRGFVSFIRSFSSPDSGSRSGQSPMKEGLVSVDNLTVNTIDSDDSFYFGTDFEEDDVYVDISAPVRLSMIEGRDSSSHGSFNRSGLGPRFGSIFRPSSVDEAASKSDSAHDDSGMVSVGSNTTASGLPIVSSEAEMSARGGHRISQSSSVRGDALSVESKRYDDDNIPLPPPV